MRKVAAAAGPLPSDMLLSDADALIASRDLAAASAALQVCSNTHIGTNTKHTVMSVTQALMQEQPDMVRLHLTTAMASLSHAAMRSLLHDSLRRLHCIQRHMTTSLQVAEALAGLLKVALADQRVRSSGIFAPFHHLLH